MTIKPQSQVNWGNPEEHFAWAFRNLPSYAGVGMLTDQRFLKAWSVHFVEIGAVHVDYLRTIADEFGNIHVSKLPKQSKKFQEAFKGPHSHWNPASQWVPMDRPDPVPTIVPDVSKMNRNEQEAVIAQLRAQGLIKENVIQRDQAKVIMGDS